ncbi:MAG: hypothetical protein WA047_18355 [Phenylobacterium sp.]|uniref:hypothetical protein n=1 Tax=Phenylobacterium sp. TaxID=1871053 RepID=UPI003BB4EF21
MNHLEHWLAAHAALASFATSIVSAIATLSAVLVAWRTAASTQRTVLEMREARFQAIRPVLYLSAREIDFKINLRRERDRFARLTSDDDEGQTELFELRNAVSPPAFDISLDWKIEDLGLSENTRLVSLQHASESNKSTISYENDGIRISGGRPPFEKSNRKIKYAGSADSFHFELIGEQSKDISLPAKIQNYIMAYAIHKLERRQIYKEDEFSIKKNLSVDVHCKSPSGEAISRRFEFSVWIWSGEFQDSNDTKIPIGSLPNTWSEMVVRGEIRAKANEPEESRSLSLPLAAWRRKIAAAIKRF